MQAPARTHDRCLCLSHEGLCISATDSFIFFSDARSNANPNSGACSNTNPGSDARSNANPNSDAGSNTNPGSDARSNASSCSSYS